MVGFFDYWQIFNKYADDDKLTSSAMLLYCRLLNAFNKAKFPPVMSFSDESLKEACHLSKKSIQDARSLLKLHKLIEYTPGSGTKKSQYSLVAPTKNEQVATRYSQSSHKVATSSRRSINYIGNNDKEIETGDRAREGGKLYDDDTDFSGMGIEI